ncbi:MAG: acetate--CoA ligase [Legionellales bacterium]|nr:acetate--CoA ligase [Legionellales bacterium]
MATTYSSKPHSNHCYLDEQQYQSMYKNSLDNLQSFWDEMARQHISWYHHWDVIFDGDFRKGEFAWYEGGKLNACYNCVDRHLPDHSKDIALIWEGEDPSRVKIYTYEQLYQEVCRFANVLKRYRVKKGDRVCIYLPMIPEALFAMLACARIGAVHTVIFSGFSSYALRDRILDAEAKIIITADGAHRNGNILPLKQNVDVALQACPDVERVIVISHTQQTILWRLDRDVNYNELRTHVHLDCPCVEMEAEDPLFILYTSGSTGRPKGVVHTTGGYMTYVACTFKYAFNYHPGDVYWCSADVGWITGHSYITYGPFANAATVFMYEGTPTYPDPARTWEMIDRHHINIFYTSPTLVRSLRKEGDRYVTRTNRRSLKILGSVGEPINPSTWEWFYNVVGEKFCPIIDTWWQTETGGLMISPLPGCGVLKPGCASRPFFGIEVDILSDAGGLIKGEGVGNLVIRRAWPGMARTIYGDHRRFVDTYLKRFAGCYATGDRAKRDNEGYYWIMGRSDDVINVSGHRLGTAEVESVLVAHEVVAEAAVVGVNHEIKGQGIYAFIQPMTHDTPDNHAITELNQLLRQQIGPIVQLDVVQWVSALPKTRSGKILRRILRKIANNDLGDLGDTSTLANESILTELMNNRKEVVIKKK